MLVSHEATKSTPAMGYAGLSSYASPKTLYRGGSARASSRSISSIWALARAPFALLLGGEAEGLDQPVERGLVSESHSGVLIGKHALLPDCVLLGERLDPVDADDVLR